MSNDTNDSGIVLSQQQDVKFNSLSQNKWSSKSSTPQKLLGLRSKMGVYDKEPLSLNVHSDKNIS